MTRCLDLAPSTELGQKYIPKSKLTGERTSDQYGYAPAYQAIAHINNPSEHRDSQKKVMSFDVVAGRFH